MDGIDEHEPSAVVTANCVNTTRRTPDSPSVYMLKAFKGNAFDGILNGLVIVMVSVNLAVALVFLLVGVHFACVAANGVILGVRRHDDWRTVIHCLRVSASAVSRSPSSACMTCCSPMALTRGVLAWSPSCWQCRPSAA